jgi:NADPH:quinone reductase-like Zn-dependent oxidoreductase
MHAMVYERYGATEKVLELREIERPVPGPNEVLIKVHAASVNAYDWHLLRADPAFARLVLGLFRPKNKVLGGDVAGTVEAVGAEVTGFKRGDALYGDVTSTGGAFAEYARAREDRIVLKPDTLSFEEAAAIPMAASTALQSIRDAGRIQAGEAVLLNGASGGVGSFALQIAKAYGAHVTTVTRGANADLVRSLGADRVIDYTAEDVSRDAQGYDLIVDVGGTVTPPAAHRLLKQGGRCVVPGFSTTRHMLRVALFGRRLKRDRKSMALVSEKPNAADLRVLNQLIEAGKLRPLIDTCYPFRELAAAIRHVDEGRARGKVVVTME